MRGCGALRADGRPGVCAQLHGTEHALTLRMQFWAMPHTVPPFTEVTVRSYLSGTHTAQGALGRCQRAAAKRNGGNGTAE